MTSTEKPATSKMFVLYHVLATIILTASLPLYLLKNKGRFKERLGLNLPNLGESEVGRLWVHALSVGELLSAIPLLEALRNRYPSREIVLSVKTATGLKVARERLKGEVHCLLPMPLDFWWSVRRMIKDINPSVFILVETDIWPGLISILKRRGVKTILVNGRVSPRTEKSYRRWRFFTERLLRPLELSLMQTQLDKDRIIGGGISPDKAKITGNIKFDRRWRPLQVKERNGWLQLLNRKDGPIWVAGSTHHPEEKIIFNVFGQLTRSFPGLCLIIGPREAHRFDEVYYLARDLGFKAIRKTELPAEDQDHNVFILNTLGELGQVYGLADVAFVGGSLVSIGGHNLLEPASFGISVLFGPYTHNFATMSELLIKCGGGKMVADESELLHAMVELLGQRGKREQMGKRARQFVEQNQGALDRVMGFLEPYIEVPKVNNTTDTRNTTNPKSSPMKTVNWSAIHAKRQRNVITFPLKVMSLIYGLAVQLRLIAYKIGLLPIKSLPTYIVSIGNITAGGTGKTPLVAMLAQWAGNNGFRVGILSRGYKGKGGHNTLVVSDGKRVLASVDDAGDEPFLLAKKLPSVPVLISKERYRVGHLALRLFNSELLLLDDGYQHLSLHRDLNILLLDAKRQFGNRSLLPLGPLREPVEQIKRADLIIITRCSIEHPGDDLVDFLRQNFPGRPIFRSGHFPEKVIFPLAGKAHPPSILSGKKVVAFAGMANPDDFLEMLKGLGAHITHFKAFSDHHPFTEDEIEEVASWKRRSDGDFLLTTEKDWVRIYGKIGVDLDIAILTIKIGLLSGEDTFFDIIRQGICKGPRGSS